MSSISHTIAFDDAPFDRAFRGDVPVVGVVCAETRLEGVITTRVRRDGANATAALARAILTCRFAAHLQAVLLQGIALAGFNVVDIHALAKETGRPLLVVARRRPDMVAIRRALLERVRGGRRKWALIERAGPMERVEGVYVQRVGLTLSQAQALVARLVTRGKIPEPLRLAHLIAGGIHAGQSTGRA